MTDAARGPDRRLPPHRVRGAPWWAASLAISAALVSGACGDEGGAEAPGSSGSADIGTIDAHADRTDGTLTLGDRTFAFRVTACDLSEGEAEGTDETLRGTGTTEDGTRLTVVVDRGLVGGRPIHSVSLHYGQVMSGTGFMASAQRIQSEAGWTHIGGDARNEDTALVQIEGRTVRAHGTFDVDDAGAESVVEGRMEITCPR